MKQKNALNNTEQVKTLTNVWSVSYTIPQHMTNVESIIYLIKVVCKKRQQKRELGTGTNNGKYPFLGLLNLF